MEWPAGRAGSRKNWKKVAVQAVGKTIFKGQRFLIAKRYWQHLLGPELSIYIFLKHI